MDVAAKLSRKAISTRGWDAVNALGLGAAGTGGDTVCLALKMERAHTHTAIAPVCINFHCWVARWAGTRIYPDGRTEKLLQMLLRQRRTCHDMAIYHLSTPLREEDVRRLKVSDVVYLSGHIFTARDMAYLRIQSLLKEGGPLPKDFAGAAFFHGGPLELKNSDGSWQLNVIGPTTSIRREPYAAVMGGLGLGAVIGKGGMAEDALRACGEYGYVYLQAAPGSAAKLTQGVEGIENVTWLDMGMPEAIWDLRAREFGPLVVGMDTQGDSIYASLREAALEQIASRYPA